MTIPRRLLVDVNVTRFYHCISRCVRGAALCGGQNAHRKDWIKQRLEMLSQAFAISVSGFAVMDNHLHILVRLDPSCAEEMSDAEVIRRWWIAYPPSKIDLSNEKQVSRETRRLSKNKKRIAELRERLKNLGWFMKALKEPLARLANREDDCKGTFWEGRYKSIAILDEEALLATCAYIDLNPLAAGIVSKPEASHDTSLRQRLEHAFRAGVLPDLELAKLCSTAVCEDARNFEESHWLCPFDNRRDHSGQREGMLTNFSFGSYLLLIDYASRLRREGKASVQPELADIFNRLRTSSDTWISRLQKLSKSGRPYGNHFSVSRARLRELAARKNVRHLDNVIEISTVA